MLSTNDQERIVGEVLTSLNLERYALQTDLPDWQRYVDRGEMETFLGDKFLTHQELCDFDYVNRVELEQALEDRVSVPMGGGDGDMEVKR